MKPNKGSKLLRLKKSTVFNLKGLELDKIQGGNTYLWKDYWTMGFTPCAYMNYEEWEQNGYSACCSIRTRPQ